MVSRLLFSSFHHRYLMYTLLRNEILTLDKLTGNLIETFICSNAATAALATLPCFGDPQPSNLQDTKAKLRIILHLQNKQTRTQILSWSKGKKGIGSHRSNARVFLVLDSVVLTEYSSLLTSINYEENWTILENSYGKNQANNKYYSKMRFEEYYGIFRSSLLNLT